MQSAYSRSHQQSEYQMITPHKQGEYQMITLHKLGEYQMITPNNQAIGQMRIVFTHDLGDEGSIPGRHIPKTQKMVFDATLLNTQHYKVRING